MKKIVVALLCSLASMSLLNAQPCELTVHKDGNKVIRKLTKPCAHGSFCASTAFTTAFQAALDASFDKNGKYSQALADAEYIKELKGKTFTGTCEFISTAEELNVGNPSPTVQPHLGLVGK